MSAIDRLIWDRLAAYGMPAHHAAGILGNFVQESGLRPDIENGIGAYGLGQWLGPRRKALEDYASKQGRSASDPELQTDFLIHELNGSESKAARALQVAKTPGEAAAIFRRAYERPGEAEANDERRISAANKLFQKLSPIGTAYADEFPRSGPGTGWQETNPDYAQQFNPADYGLVPDETPTADYGNRPDGTKKGRGYLGEIQRPDGSVMTEYSVGVDFDGKERDIPTLVPTLSGDEIETLRNLQDGAPIPQSIMDKAVTHARQRIAQGLDPFQSEEDTFNPAEYGLVPDDEPVQQQREMKAFPDPMTGSVGDFVAGAGSSLARQGQGLMEGLQGAGRAMGMGENPAFSDMPLLSPDKMKLLSATLKRDSQMGEAGAIAGDLAPFLAMSPAFGVAYSAAATPGDMGDRATAAGLSAAGAGVGSGLARMIRGFTPSAAAQTLMGEGVTPTVGQGIEQGVLGRAIRRGEEASTSLPLAGATTRSARSRAAEQWTRAVLGRAEGDIAPGISISANGLQGNEAILSLRKSFNNAYDTVLQGQVADINRGLVAQVNSVIDDPNLFINAEGRQWAKAFIDSQLKALPTQNGIVPASALKRVSDELASRGAPMLKRQSQQEADIGRALLEAESVISQHIDDSLSPELRGIMEEIDKRYANFKRIQRAAATTKDAEGHFTPADLHRSVKMLDTALDRARFAEGGALLQDLSRAGKSVIPETLGESGTTPRALVAKLAAGGVEGAGLVSDAATYGSLAALMGAGSREPVQRALLGGYGWQRPVSEWASGWMPQVGAGLGYDFGR